MVLAAAATTPYRRLDRMLLAAAAESAIKVDVDLTSIVQLALFVGLTLILKPVLFDPMLKLFEERERRIDGAKLEARKTDEKSAHALSEYEAAMNKARATANAERERIRAEGVKRETEILATVRAATTKVLDEGKRAMQIETDKARAELKAQGPALARELATRVLGREVQS
jgi:F-type H+-transporting ATPase subunit b